MCLFDYLTFLKYHYKHQVLNNININNMDPKIIERAKSWLTDLYDAETKKQVQDMLDNDPNELVESISKIGPRFNGHSLV